MSQSFLGSIRPQGRRLGGPPPRVALAVDWLEDTYQTEVLRGASAVAQERGVTLVVLPGGVLGAHHSHGEERNPLYKLITPQQYDALVMMTGTLGNASASDPRDRVCPGFPREKICSVAIDLPGSSSVLIDNGKGTREAVEHLIRTHGCRHIGFIRGPQSNAEAETRYRAYRDALEKSGIEFREELVFQGDFRREAGLEAIRTLFDERSVHLSDIDALVAADDSMALAALEELRRRKVTVPFELAVVGFDDVEECRFSSPPLSSIRQPLMEQGRAAMKLALSALGSGAEVSSVTLETQGSWRRSCGCRLQDDAGLSERPSITGSLSLEASLIKRRELVLAEITRATGGAFLGLGRGWEIKLFNGLHDELRGKSGAFRASYDRLLELVLDGGGDVSSGNAIISALRKQLNLGVAADLKQLQQVESLLHEARILTSDMVERSQAQRRLKVELAARVQSEVSAKLLTSFSLTELATRLAGELPRIGIKNCAICTYLENGTAKVEASLGWEVALSEVRDVIFPRDDVLPDALHSRDEPGNFVVQLLLNRELQPVGHLVFRLEEAGGHIFELLRTVVAGALEAAQLVQSRD